MPTSPASDLRLARLTAAQVRAMIDAEILPEGAPYELLDGLLVHKDRSATGGDPMTVGEKHNLVVQLLIALNAELLPVGCYLQSQGPLRLSETTEPEPDGVVLRGTPRDYAGRLPHADDALIVIEVSDSSLEVDRGRKKSLYAAANVGQYIIINIRELVIEVSEEPSADPPEYKKTTLARAADTVRLRLGEAVVDIKASQLLP